MVKWSLDFNEEKQNRAKTFGLYINVLVTCGLLALLVSGSLLLYWEQISFILGKDMRFSYNVFYTGLVLTPSVIISLNYEYLRGIGKNSLFFLFQSVLVPSFTLIFDVIFQAFFLSYSLAIYVTLLISFCFVFTWKRSWKIFLSNKLDFTCMLSITPWVII